MQPIRSKLGTLGHGNGLFGEITHHLSKGGFSGGIGAGAHLSQNAQQNPDFIEHRGCFVVFGSIGSVRIGRQIVGENGDQSKLKQRESMEKKWAEQNDAFREQERRLDKRENSLEKKMDLIIQITPSVVRGEVAGITKTKAMIDVERSINADDEQDDTEKEQEGENNDN